MRRRLLRLAGAAVGLAALYLLNRLVLAPHTGGGLHRFLSGYFADLLAGPLMLLVLNGALALAGRRAVTGVRPAAAFLLACGLFWEVATPLYLPRSVGDPWDLAAYCAGGLAFLPLLRRLVKPPEAM